MPRNAVLHVAILGAGPIGLEAALHARKLGAQVTIFERGRIAEHVQRWGHVKMFTPFGQITTALGREAIRNDHPQHKFPPEVDPVFGHEFVSAYLQPLAQLTRIKECLKLEQSVVAVSRPGQTKTDARTGTESFRLLLRDGKGQELTAEADVIIDCTGTYARPRFLGDGGIPAAGEMTAGPHISYWLDDVAGPMKAKYAGKMTLVVGGGYSAATQVCQLAQLAEQNPATWVIWLARGPRSQPMQRSANDPFRERDRLAARANGFACRGDGNVEFHALANVDRVVSRGPDQGFEIHARVGGKPAYWEVDRVIANVGYAPDFVMTRELHIDWCGRQELPHVSEPNYHILGAKAVGRTSQFLLKPAYEQVADLFRSLAPAWERRT